MGEAVASLSLCYQSARTKSSPPFETVLKEEYRGVSSWSQTRSVMTPFNWTEWHFDNFDTCSLSSTSQLKWINSFESNLGEHVRRVCFLRLPIICLMVNTTGMGGAVAGFASCCLSSCNWRKSINVLQIDFNEPDVGDSFLLLTLLSMTNLNNVPEAVVYSTLLCLSVRVWSMCIIILKLV